MGFVKRGGKGGNAVVGLDDQGNSTGLSIGKNTLNIERRKSNGQKDTLGDCGGVYRVVDSGFHPARIASSTHLCEYGKPVAPDGPDEHASDVFRYIGIHGMFRADL